ncbi:MAG: hypothetical protein JXR64_08310 [Spirochaetales bacterium]|nr:hypothetical protein [Spirochaetales bacterium]
MKKGNGNYISSQLLIQLTIGIYFFISGLLGIMGYNSGMNQVFNDVNKLMGKNNYLPLIISIVFLVAGLFLLLASIIRINNRFIYFAIFALWIVYIIYSYFTNNFIEPELLVWLKNLSREVIILAGLWFSTQRK